MKSTLKARIKMGANEEIVCDILEVPGGRQKISIYPVNGRTYWKSHSDISLTQRELRAILEASQVDS